MNEIKYTLETPNFNADAVVNDMAQVSDNSRIVSLGDTKVPALEKTTSIKPQIINDSTVEAIQPQPVQNPNTDPNMFNGIPQQMLNDVQTYMGNENMSAESMQAAPTFASETPSVSEQVGAIPTEAVPTVSEPISTVPEMPVAQTETLPVEDMPMMSEPVTPIVPTEPIPVTSELTEQPTTSIDESTPSSMVNPLENPLYSSISIPGASLEQPMNSLLNQEPKEEVAEPTPIETTPVMSAPAAVSVTPVGPEASVSALESIAPSGDISKEVISPVVANAVPEANVDVDDEIIGLIESAEESLNKAKEMLANKMNKEAEPQVLEPVMPEMSSSPAPEPFVPAAPQMSSDSLPSIPTIDEVSEPYKLVA